MATWVEAGEGRWVRSDDDRHLLLHSGGRFVEHEIATLHVYEGEPGDDPDNPMADTSYVGTFGRPDLAGVDVPALWQAMGSADYLKPATR